MSRPVNQQDNYLSRLLKNIPSEIIGVYVAATAITIVKENNTVLWIVFVSCFISTPLWLYFVEKVTSWLQITLSSISFVIWVMTLGGPFLAFWPEITNIGAIVLIFYTALITPIITGISN